MPGPEVKDWKQYEALRKKGMSKARAAAIANSGGDKSDGETMSTESAAVPSVQTAPNSVYAAIRAAGITGPSTPEWKKIVKIDYTDKGPVTTVVQDYKLSQELSALIEKALRDQADSDDPPEQQQYLMTAWQAMAMYLASCDDEDQNAAATALKFISDMMSDSDSPSGPFPDGTFGRTVQTAAQDVNKTVYECAMDNRKFSTQAGLLAHLQNAHSMAPTKAKAMAAKQGGKS